MAFINRRKLLSMGAGAGVVARLINEYHRDRLVRNEQENLIDTFTKNPESIIDTAFNLESEWETEISRREQILSATELVYPNLDYNRDLSTWMIQSCKLAVQQYKTGRNNPRYDGDLTLLPDYNANFHNYQQLTSFQIEEEIVENYLRLESRLVTEDDESSMMTTLHDAESKIRRLLKNIASRSNRHKLFIGFVIASEKSNIIAFRGTQTQVEWWHNLQAIQQDYRDLENNKLYGRVHRGYLTIVRNQINSLLFEAVKQLNPELPCYVTGHSLGAAIATLAAFEIALNFPEIRKNLQLYTYAGPRVGDRDFAQAHSKMIPNSYRIVNLSDFVPLVPPITIDNQFTQATYAHVGQKWGFTSQFGDVLLNHVVDTYRSAIEAQQEIPLENPLDQMM